VRSSAQVHVIFVVCKGRSGSTLLDRLLGGAYDAFSCGELDRFWVMATSGDAERCSCGSTLAACPVWSRVAHHPAVASALDRRRRDGPAKVTCSEVAALYEAITAETGSMTLVDSSKSIKALLRAARHPGLTVSAVHLVRDPRAVAYSWSRAKPLADRPDETMQRRGIVDSAITWLAKNAAIEAVLPFASQRSLRIRYEDLAVDPQATLDRVNRALFGVEAEPTHRDAANHQIAGNPSRFTKGVPTVRLDTRWSTEGSAGMRMSVMALTWPLAVAYGYV
jgi:hypothetical protein